MKRIIVSLYKYKPTVASTIRVMAYIKSFLNMGYEVILVTTSDDEMDLKDEKLSVVLYNEYRKGAPSIAKLLNDYRLVEATKKVYKSGDIIYTYQVPLFGFLYPKSWNVFYEETERGLLHWLEDVIATRFILLFAVSEEDVGNISTAFFGTGNCRFIKKILQISSCKSYRCSCNTF